MPQQCWGGFPSYPKGRFRVSKIPLGPGDARARHAATFLGPTTDLTQWCSEQGAFTLATGPNSTAGIVHGTGPNAASSVADPARIAATPIHLLDRGWLRQGRRPTSLGRVPARRLALIWPR